MDLQGNIEKFTLVDILQLLATGRKSGTLGIQRDESIIMVYFEAGDIVYGYGPRETFYLGKLLTEQGKITEKQLEAAIAIQAQNNNTKRLGEILINNGAIDRADLEDVVRTQVKELLYSLLSWHTGSFKFYENEFPTKEEIKVSLSVENVILEGLRRLDEENMIRETLPDKEEIYQISLSQAGRTRALTMKASEWNVMALVDGYRSLNEICKASSFKDHDTMSRLAQLKLAGLIEPGLNKTKPTTDESSLEPMITRLSHLFENYLTQKSGSQVSKRDLTQILVGDSSSESH